MASSKEKKEKRNIDPEKGLERVRKKRTRMTVNRRLLTVLTVILLAAVFAVLVVTLFFRVSEVRVVGNTHYNDQDIIDASGIEYKKNIFLIDSGNVASSIISQFPFIKTVRLSRQVPSTIVLKLESDEALFYTDIAGEFFIISRDMRVVGIEKSAEDAEKRYPGTKRLVTPAVSEAVVGREIVFVRESYADEVRKLAASLSASEVFEGVTTFDVSNKFAVRLIYGHKIKATLGDASDFDLKLRFLNEIIKDVGDKGGTVDLDTVEMGYFIPSDGESYD